MTTADQPRDYRATAGTRSKKDEAKSALAVKRSRGMLSALALILLGIWGGLIHFIGPYFSYQADQAGAWALNWDRFWLGIVPAVATIVGGLLLGPAANRAVGSLGAWLALAGGIWFIIAPSVVGFWMTSSPTLTMSIAEQLGIFYALGALITSLAAFALGRMTVRSVKDIKD